MEEIDNYYDNYMPDFDEIDLNLENLISNFQSEI